MNLSIVVAFSKIEDAKKIRTILNRQGFEVTEICTTGAGVLSCMSHLDAGILVCGYRLPDMNYYDILDAKSEYFEMVLIASENKAVEAEGRMRVLRLPITASMLSTAVSELLEKLHNRIRKNTGRPGSRSEKEKRLILEAKELLMRKKNWTEMQAHRYLQKSSMDNGTSMVETAEMIRMLYQ